MSGAQFRAQDVPEFEKIKSASLHGVGAAVVCR
jgi:hypothetical protein